jgi:lipoprotein-anchoring transpeptidase ErfK/SrfK
MGRDARYGARRASAARAALAAATAAVVATVLMGLSNAQAQPQVSAPDLPVAPAAPVSTRPAPVQEAPAPPAAAPSRTAPVQEAPAPPTRRPTAARDAEPDESADTERRAPERVRAAAPLPPQPTPRRALPQVEPAGGPPAVPGTPCTAAARACVALNERRAWLLDAGKVVRGPVPIQHGDVKDPTPRGTFEVQWKAEQYTSREYLTQMPYSVFFAEGGIAFHEGAQGNPSAGCVKLGPEDARAFFYFLQVGDEVQIH